MSEQDNVLLHSLVSGQLSPSAGIKAFFLERSPQAFHSPGTTVKSYQSDDQSGESLRPEPPLSTWLAHL